MKWHHLVARSLQFYWRTHLAVGLGVALSAAILVGALITGDSVRGSLRELALRRLGQTELVLTAAEGSFRTALAEEIGRALGAPTAPVAYAQAVLTPDGQGPVAGVDLFGIDDRFLAFTPQGAERALPPGAGEVLLGERLAQRIEARPGDEVLLRFERPSALPRDVGLIPTTDRSATLRVTVRGVLPDAALGRFSLRAEQTAPLNAFVSREALATALGQPERVSLALLGSDGKGGPSLEAAQAALRSAWRPQDVGLRIEPVPGKPLVQLSTERVFLPPVVAAAAPALGSGGAPVLSYFVHEIEAHTRLTHPRRTPYAFVAALGDDAFAELAGPGRGVAGRGGDRIVVNEWLADDLGVAVGDELVLRYVTIDEDRRLMDGERPFQVAAIVPVEAGDPAMAPPLPGLTGKAHCRDWDPGLPVDLDHIRPKDEAYWQAHRGTPKAYVSLSVGQAMWSNRYGDVTAVRYEGASDEASITRALRVELDPAAVGLSVQGIRAAALSAADPTVDFGQLFLGLSFFLIVSALLLTALLFTFSVEQRFAELGTLRAVGFTAKKLRRLVLAEGAGIAIAGAALGSALGALYATSVTSLLRTVWVDAIGMTGLSVHLSALSITIGAAVTVLVALTAMALSIRRTTRLSPRVLMRGSRELDAARVAASAGGAGRAATWVTALALLLGLALFAAGLGGFGGSGGSGAAGIFFAAGGLVLVGGVGLCHLGLLRLARASQTRALTLAGVGLRASARNAGRRLLTVAMLATGVFLVIAVGANRPDLSANAGERSHGTGGFALVVESTRPIIVDLNDPEGREEAFAIDARLEGVTFVPLRVGGGEDASCLNLNRVATPRLLGVDPEALASRGAFSFSSTLSGRHADSPWRLLSEADDLDVIPAAADANTVTWALRKKLGDTLPYVDEDGRAFQVRIVALLQGSMLQGSLLIDRDRFRDRFPSTEGYRMLLVDAPPGATEAVATSLRRALRDHGVEVVRAPLRLAAYQSVENTYLSIFLALGGLALALGTLGVAVSVVRSLLERRGELALLRAVGFSQRRLEVVSFVEHGALVLAGLVTGLGAAVIAIWPTLRAGGVDAPLGATAAWAGVIAASGLICVGLAVRAGVRRPLLAALREE